MIATYRPVELLPIVKNLVDFWKRRIYIGNFQKIFESYKLISDEKLKNGIKKSFKFCTIQLKKLIQILKKLIGIKLETSTFKSLILCGPMIQICMNFQFVVNMG